MSSFLHLMLTLFFMAKISHASTLTKNKPVLDTSATIQLSTEHAGNFHDLWQLAEKVKLSVSREKVDSEVSGINRVRTLKVSNDLIELIRRANDLHSSTFGYFNCSIGTMEQDEVPSKKVLKKSPSELIEIQGNQVRLKNESTVLDLERIKEGYLVDKMAALLKKRRVESAIIKVGNSSRCLAECKIEISNPFSPAQKWAILHGMKKDLSVSTFGFRKHYLKQKEKQKLVNPKTGKDPSQLAGVTVVSMGDNTRSSAFAAAILHMPEHAIKKVINSYSDIGLILVSKSGEIRTSANIFKFVNSIRMSPENWQQE